LKSLVRFLERSAYRIGKPETGPVLYFFTLCDFARIKTGGYKGYKKTAGETLNRRLNAFICLTLNSLFPLRISETTP